jgi:hypothetical protein
MNGAKVHVLKDSYKVCFGSFLKNHEGGTLKRASQESGMEAPISFAISRTNRWNGALASKRSVDF